MGSQKVPGMVVLHFNGRIYVNACLVTFKVESMSMRMRMRTRTHTPSILPLLEAPAEGIFWNLPEFGCSIRFGAHVS
jgi:hypothetical protein